MNIPKEAIEKAVNEGWRPDFLEQWHPFEWYKTELPSWKTMCCDPTFWQALGKALGWRHCRIHTGTPNEAMCDDVTHDEWFARARRFYDLILQGKDTAEFWVKLLN